MVDQSDKTRRNPHPRWYHLTPDRLILALLPVEALLWLSERFQWFPKGYAVLIAGAAVGVFLLLMLLWFIAALLFGLRFQFSIRSLMLLTLVVAVLCSWLAVQRKEAREQRAVVEVIEKMGGGAAYDQYFAGSNSGPPVSAAKLLGDDFFSSVPWHSSGAPGPRTAGSALQGVDSTPESGPLRHQGHGCCVRISSSSPSSKSWTSAAPRLRMPGCTTSNGRLNSNGWTFLALRSRTPVCRTSRDCRNSESCPSRTRRVTDARVGAHQGAYATQHVTIG